MKRTSSKPRLPCGLIFGEDRNDADALGHLTRAIWPTVPKMKYLRRPLVLIRDRQGAEARKENANDIAAAVKAASVQSDVRLVMAHRDCDAIEPAHESVRETIRAELEAAGLANVISVAPAWEIEAWWFLWPDAVAAVNSKWNRLKRKGNHGMIENAKEALRRDLRSERARDYEESDSAKIAEKVLTMKLVSSRVGTCNSFIDFESRVREVSKLSEDPRR